MPDQPAAPPLFRAAPVALLRAPLRPGSERPDWAAAAGPDGSTPADRATCLALLRGAAADRLFMDALRLASPSLARVVAATAEPATAEPATVEPATVGEPGSTAAGRSDAQLRRAVTSVLRYELRLRSRCTPFGLFAGVAPLRFEEPTGLPAPAKVAWTEPPTSRTRVDLDWLFRLIRRLEQQPELLPQLTLHRHAGTIRRGSRLVMTAPSNPGGSAGDTRHNEVSVRLTPVVAAALELAGSGPTGATVAAELQHRFPQATAAQITGLLAALVQQEFLITDLRPVLDGGDPLGRMIEVLAAAERSAGRALPMLSALRAIAADRDRYDSTPLGERRGVQAALEERMRQLADSERLLHVDLALGAEVRLPHTVAEEAARSLEVLWNLTPTGIGLPHLRSYHREFLERYGANRAVPLVEVLDETIGLGAPAGYGWPASGRPEEKPTGSARARELLLARLVAGAVRAGERELVLDDAMVARLTAAAETGSGQAPRSCQAFYSLLANDQQALAEGDFLLVTSGGPSDAEAGAMFGRFAGLPGTAESVNTLLDELAELAFPEAEGSIHLGVAYQPRLNRALNVANSRRCAEHQVSIGLPPDPGATAVPLEEIGVAANGDHLYAVHLPTGRRLLPHAHNALDLHGLAPNLARFLLELGREAHRLCMPWDWGAAARSPFLPRVRHGRVVLCSATWRMDELSEETGLDPANWAAAVDGWRQRWAVPEQIVLTRFDRRLPLDLSQAWHRELLREEIAKDQDVVAVELPGGEQRSSGWLRDAQGYSHAAELAVAFTTVAQEPVGHPAPQAPVPQARGRVADPGGEWLYARLYLASRQTEGFLCEQLPAFLAKLPEPVGELIDSWFFVRYRDDADHLRLRFHGPEEQLWPQLLPPLRDAVARWRGQGLVGGFVLDSYDPEWERYGGLRAQAAAERFFTADSRTALQLLATGRRRPPTASAGPDGRVELPWDREVLAALSVVSIAHAFGAPNSPDSPDGANGASRANGPHGAGSAEGPARYREPAAAWLRAHAGGSDKLPSDFRSRRADWLRLIDPAGDHPGLAGHQAEASLRAALADQAVHLAAYRAELDRLTERGENPSPLSQLLPSLLHMSCNRLLGPDRDAELRAMALARACAIGNADRRRHQR